MEGIDKEEISKAVALLNEFTKTFCRYPNDYERFGDSKFRCKECPFKQGSSCRCKEFKLRYDPDYKRFGIIGDL